MNSMRRWVAPALVTLLAFLGAGGCAESPGAGEPTAEPAAPTPLEAEVATDPRVPESPLPVDGCLKGGTTRAEVRALLGEPDSISWGVWLYGRSEITFGYGVVVAFADVDENLEVC